MMRSFQPQRFRLICLCLAILSANIALADDVTDLRDATPGEDAAGTLRTVGHYPGDLVRQGETVTQLADGTVFVYGAESRGTFKNGAIVLDPIERRKLAQYLEPEAIGWDPKRGGWVKRGRPTECPLNLHLHTATRLGDSKILFAGGLCDASVVTNDASSAPPSTYNKLSIWNQATQTWESAPPLAHGRLNHTATLLADGSVLIVGGHDDRRSDDRVLPVFASVELFVDAADQPSTVTPMPALLTPRAQHAAVRLKDGRVMIIGGAGGDNHALASVEIFDPKTKSWREGAGLDVARYQHTAELLDDGRVLVIGGINSEGRAMSSVEIYSPTTDSWTAAPQLLVALKTLSSVKLTSGDVLVTGTTDNEYRFTVSFAMLWKKSISQWRPAGALSPDGLADIYRGETYQLVAQENGSALVFGNRVVMQWLPSAVYSASYQPSNERTTHATVELADGRFLLAGGRVAHHPTPLTVIYDPTSNTFTLTNPMRQARYTGMPFQASLASTVLDDGRVVIAGGWVLAADDSRRTVPNSPDVWNPITGRWDIIAGLRFEPFDRVYFNALDDGRVLFFVSREQEEEGVAEFHAWVWDPHTDRIVQRSVSAKARAGASVTVLRDGRVLIVGGRTLQLTPEYRCPLPSADSRSSDEDEEGDGCQDEPARWLANGVEIAEMWDSNNGYLSEIAFPHPLGVEKIQSLLLRNGNVLLINADYTRLNSRPGNGAVLLWNARTNSFSELPRLGTQFNWPITEQSDGSLIAWGGENVTPATVPRLQHGASEWETMPRFPQAMAVVRETAAGKLLALSSSSPHVTVWDEESGVWALHQDKYLPVENPAVVDLGNRALAVVGTVFGNRIGMQTWNPDTRTWKMDPITRPDRTSLGRAVRLRSGAILTLSGGKKSRLICDIWRPSDRTWNDCGEWAPENGDDHSRFTLGELADGRVAFIAGPNNARIFDETSARWTMMKAEWNTKGFHQGEAVHASQPLLRLYDADAGAWIDASAVSGQYYSHSGRGQHMPSMLWDGNKKRWAYIANDVMGKEGFWLPDGCAISGLQFALYNPADGKMTRLEHVITGFDARAMTVQSDGTVVVVGIPNSTSDAGGLFRRRASCAGFEAGDPVFVSMPGIYVSPTAAPVVTPAEPVVIQSLPLRDRMLALANENRWVLLAILGPLALYFLLRFAINAFISRAPASALARSINQSTAERVELSLVRIAGYTVALLIAVPLLLNVFVTLPTAQIEEVLVEPSYRDANSHRLNAATYRFQVGYERAKKNGTASHADCRKLEAYPELQGCDRYVTEHKTFPPHVHQGNWDSGKTTAQCREEVSAYWDAYVQEDLELGKTRSSDPFSGIQETKRRELAECQNYDNLRGG